MSAVAEGTGGAGTIRPESRLTFCELSVVPNAEEFLVGHAASGTFVSLPEIGVTVLRALQQGATVGHVAQELARLGQDVDVADFAGTLRDLGFVTAVDGIPTQALPDAPRQQTWLAGVRPEVIRPFVGKAAWTVYGLLLLFCLALFLVQPAYWPSFEDAFFYPDPAICVTVLLLSRILAGAGHELCHWLAGRAAGVGARFSISRRLLFVVFQTDLSQLMTLPATARYSPLLAGMAFDTVLLALSLLLRLGARTERIPVPPLLERFLGAFVLSQVLSLSWQLLLFYRTDLYAVLVTKLGCMNLYRINYLYLKRSCWRLTAAEAAALAGAHSRDLLAARWFAWLYVAGIGLAVYFFTVFFLPGVVVMSGWVLGSLRGASPGSAAFWEALTLGGIALIQMLAPVAVLVWERLTRRKEAAV